jgi:hypothetical protein
MRRIVILLNGLLAESYDESAFSQDLTHWSTLSGLGSVFRIHPLPPLETPEGFFLGYGPNEAELADGPLTVSALGAEPPDDSIQFHLSLASFDGTSFIRPEVDPDADLASDITRSMSRLNTSKLTLLSGIGLDHGLVWERRGDLATFSPAEATHGPIRQYLPVGDGEVELRRLIDDSINLLSELELNQRRVDEGLAPFNLLWPWGQGYPKKVPNLGLRYGERVEVESSSMRLAGLVRLAGLRHGSYLPVSPEAFMRRMSLSLESNLAQIYVVDHFPAIEELEPRHWLARFLDQHVLSKLVKMRREETLRISLYLLGRSGKPGLALLVDPKDDARNRHPFDERSLQDRAVIGVDLWKSIAAQITL